jgi:hypothetical protein
MGALVVIEKSKIYKRRAKGLEEQIQPEKLQFDPLRWKLKHVGEKMVLACEELRKSRMST